MLIQHKTLTCSKTILMYSYRSQFHFTHKYCEILRNVSKGIIISLARTLFAPKSWCRMQQFSHLYITTFYMFLNLEPKAHKAKPLVSLNPFCEHHWVRSRRAKRDWNERTKKKRKSEEKGTLGYLHNPQHEICVLNICKHKLHQNAT